MALCKFIKSGMLCHTIHEYTDEEKEKYLQEDYHEVSAGDLALYETLKYVFDFENEKPKELPVYAPTLDELKAQKLTEFKNIRDTEEVKPISYNGNLFDFDDKARDRMNSAIIALSITGQSIEWTTVDNTNVAVTANYLRGVIANVAIRSNKLHVKYRELKELVEACTTKEELDNISWE